MDCPDIEVAFTVPPDWFVAVVADAALPLNEAVIILAAKSPLPSRETIVDAALLGVWLCPFSNVEFVAVLALPFSEPLNVVAPKVPDEGLKVSLVEDTLSDCPPDVPKAKEG